MDTPLWLVDSAWISFAFCCGFLARLFRLPPLIGFLAAGFLLNGLGIRQGGLALRELADLGVSLLLFTIGLKLDIKSLGRREIWLGTSVHMIACTAVLGGAVFLLTLTPLLSRLPLPMALVIGFALSFSSTVFAIKTLEEQGSLKAMHGNTAMGILVMQDLIAVIYLAVTAGKVPSPWALALPGLFFIRPLFSWLLERTGHGELLGILGLFLTMVAGAASFEAVGLKPDLGALAMGVLMGGHPKARELGKTLQSYKDLFLVAFFLNIGLSGLPDLNILTTSLILLLFIGFKGWLFFRLLTRFNFRARTALFTAIPLANYSEFGLIVTAAAVKAGWLDSRWLVLVALTLSLSFIVGAPLNSTVHNLYTRFRSLLKKYQSAIRHPDDQPISLEADILIFGMGRVGTGAYEEAVKRYGNRVAGLDSAPAVVARHLQAGRQVIFGDATDIDFWDRISTDQVRLISLCMPLHEAQLTAVSQLRQAGYQGLITATSRFDDESEELRAMGVDSVYNIYQNVGQAYADYLLTELGNRLP